MGVWGQAGGSLPTLEGQFFLEAGAGFSDHPLWLSQDTDVSQEEKDAPWPLAPRITSRAP